MARLGELDFTARDYDSTLASLVARVLADPALAGFDTSPGNPDMLLLRALATLGDRLGYLENRSVNEAFLATARLRQSVIDHCALIDYHLGTASPAVVTALISLARGYPDSTTFPAGTQLETEDGSVTYETDQALTIPAYSTSGTVPCTEGRTLTESATGLAPSAAPSGQRIVTAEGSFLWGSERVSVGPERWSRVDSFLNSSATDQHYRVELDTDDRATVLFGDGANGARPPEGSAIALSYRVGGGVRGRVRRGRLTRLLGSFATDGASPVEASVTNPADSSGGLDRETLTHAKIAAPLALRATTRTVALEDFALHALEVAGVARALCETHEQDPGIPWLMHRVYLVPVSSSPAPIPDAALLSAVETYLTETRPRGALDALQVVAAPYDLLHVVATLTAAPGTDPTELAATAESAITAFFCPSARVPSEDRYRLDFGQPVYTSELVALLQGLAGVRRVELTSPVDAPLSTSHHFPALGSVTVTVV